MFNFAVVKVTGVSQHIPFQLRFTANIEIKINNCRPYKWIQSFTHIYIQSDCGWNEYLLRGSGENLLIKYFRLSSIEILICLGMTMLVRRWN